MSGGQDSAIFAKNEKHYSAPADAKGWLSYLWKARGSAAQGHAAPALSEQDRADPHSGIREQATQPADLGLSTVIGIAVLAGLVAFISKWFFEGPGHVAVFWAANALVIGALLAEQGPPRLMKAALLVTASIVAEALAALASGDGGLAALFFALSNCTEIVLSGWLAWNLPGPKPHINRISGFLKLTVITAIIAPALSALPTAGFLYFRHADGFCHAYVTWFAADGLGNALFVPVVATLISKGAQAIVPTQKSSFLALTFSLAGFILVFSQSTIPPLFLVAPLLFPVILTAGLVGTAINLAFIAFIAVAFTLTGHGPMWALAPDNVDMRIFLLQGFLLSASISTVPVAFAFEATKTLIGKLHEQKLKLGQREAHYRNLAELSSDIILISNVNREISYISPAVERLLGFRPEDVVKGHLSDFVHADDHYAVSEAIRRLGGETREISVELRARHTDGHYVWLEVRSRIGHRAPDGNLEFISVMRDISIRRAKEDQRLVDLLRLDTLANTDPLTGLANRRRFTEQLEQEWHRAAREAAPIALLSLDADHFKAFNDRYGHPAGDDALRVIANVMGTETLRTADLVARIGGEEFAALLPGTNLQGALKVAERIRQAVAAFGICHANSQTGYLSVSIGVASTIPERDEPLQTLIAAADRALYDAKKGRDRVASDASC